MKKALIVNSWKSWGQTGHKGRTLCKSDIEEKIKSGRCKCDTKLIGNPKSGTYITKYVLDLNIEPLITEVRIYADQNGKFTIIYSFCKNFSQKVEGSIVQLESELLNQAVVSTDATTVSVNGKQGFIRNFSIESGRTF